MDRESCIQWCYRVAKAFSTGARLYAGDEQVYYYSVLHLHPDPVGPYLQRILSSRAQAGVTATPCGQFYGFLTIEPELRLIVGPTRVLQESDGSLDKLLALLAIPAEAHESYSQALRAAPVISVDRLAWILSALVTALRGKPFPVEEVWMDIRPESDHLSIQVDRIQKRLDAAYDMDTQQAARQSYTWENMICTCIEEGQPERLRTLFIPLPQETVGAMAQDGLRYLKNMGICGATVASRAAIRGGLDIQSAFRSSDLYIQKLELTKDLSAIGRLMQEMLLDFAEQVQQLRGPTPGKDRFFHLCSRYIAQNLFSPIRVEEMARELGYTRAYLCAQFKQETGMTLARYIQHAKVVEAKRLLQFTDQELSEIAAALSFSSQSHFQTVFKQITGETPTVYRRRVQKVDALFGG